MADYYPILAQAIAALEGDDPQGRRRTYDRAREILTDQLNAAEPPISDAEFDAEIEDFEAAIRRIEAEKTEAAAVGPAHIPAAQPAPIRPRPPRPVARRGLPRLAMALIATLAILGAGVTAAIYALRGKAPVPAKPEPAASAPARATAPDAVAELEPGADGGSSSAGLPYFYRRQAVYYRSNYPVGTILIQRSQNFLFLIQPNAVALRYGIGFGRECTLRPGLHRVARKDDAPVWQPLEVVNPNGAYPARMPAGPGNPLGARALHLDSDNDRIHGTNAPKTIGHAMVFGCVRLVNEDIIDLARRVEVGSRVVLLD